MFVNVLSSDTSAQLTTHNVTMVSENFNGFFCHLVMM